MHLRKILEVISMSDKPKSTTNKPVSAQQKVIHTYAQDGLDVAATQLAQQRARQEIQANANSNAKGKK